MNDAGSVVRPELAKRRHALGIGSSSEPASVAAIYLLDRGEAPAGSGPLSRVSGAEAMAAVSDLVYRPGLVRGLGLERQVFSHVAAVVKATRVMQLITPADRFAPAETAQRVLADLGL